MLELGLSFVLEAGTSGVAFLLSKMLYVVALLGFRPRACAFSMASA